MLTDKDEHTEFRLSKKPLVLPVITYRYTLSFFSVPLSPERVYDTSDFRLHYEILTDNQLIANNAEESVPSPSYSDTQTEALLSEEYDFEEDANIFQFYLTFQSSHLVGWTLNRTIY